MADWGRGSRFLLLAVRTKRQHRGSDYVKAGIKQTRQRSAAGHRNRAGKAQMSICSKFGLEFLRSKWDTPTFVHLPDADWQAFDGKRVRHCGGGHSWQERCSNRCGTIKEQQHLENGTWKICKLNGSERSLEHSGLWPQNSSSGFCRSQE